MTDEEHKKIIMQAIASKKLAVTDDQAYFLLIAILMELDSRINQDFTLEILKSALESFWDRPEYLGRNNQFDYEKQTDFVSDIADEGRNLIKRWHKVLQLQATAYLQEENDKN